MREEGNDIGSSRSNDLLIGWCSKMSSVDPKSEAAVYGVDGEIDFDAQC